MKRSRINNRSNTDKARLSRTLDRLFQDAVCARGRCEKCGKTYGLAGHHLIRRNNLWYRWMLDNAVCLCQACHRLAHDFPRDFAVWLESACPMRYEAWMANKHNRSQGPVPMSIMEGWKLELQGENT